MKPRLILVGLPNVGKSSIYNLITNTTSKVGNWPGATVEKKVGTALINNHKIEVIDLPGIYSISPTEYESIDEKITNEFLINGEYDLILNVIDGSNLERNLYLTLQLLEFNKPMIIIITKLDLIEKRGVHVDIAKLAENLNIKCLKVNPRNNRTLKLDLDFDKLTNSKWNLPQYYNFIKEEIEVLSSILDSKNKNFQAIKFLEEGAPFNLNNKALEKAKKIKYKLEEKINEKLEIFIPALRYEFIQSLISNVITVKGEIKESTGDKIDAFVLNKYLALPIFLMVIYLLFTFSITLGSLFQEPFENLSEEIFITLPKTILKALNASEILIFFIADSLGGGIVTVMTFVPIIFSLYISLAILEDIGYMARAAFIADKLMRALGLSGKAFIPLIISFGCNVPAILATRTLNNYQDKIITSMMIPFMSCGARLSVYALFCAAFFGASGYNIVFALYIIGIIIAILTGLLINGFMGRKPNAPMIIEIPNYHVPIPYAILSNAWEKTKSFIFGAGKLIVIVFIILNFLNSVTWQIEKVNEDKSDSIIASVGQTLTPAFGVMGIEKENWPAVVGIFTGIFAKEVVVGTLSALYKSLEGNFSDTVLQKYFKDKIAVFAYLLFILLYFPCISVFAVISSEIGFRWAVFSAVWSTSIAYLIAVSFYQGAKYVVN